MDDSSLRELEEAATTLAREAGKILSDYFARPLAVEYKSKGQRNPVTEADRRADDYLKEAIARRFPGHGIITEESGVAGAAAADIVWVLDPLDGTTNFVNRFPFFASSIGVLYKGIPVAGSVFVASASQYGGVIFHARQGGGAWAGDAVIKVAPNGEIDPWRLVAVPSGFSRRLQKALKGHAGEPRSLGCIAGELAYTASGVFQYAIFGWPRVWDVAAGVLLVKEAGGQVMVAGGRSRRWKALESLAEGREASAMESLKEWRAPVLAGNAQLVELVAARVKMRRRLLWRLWSTLMRRRS